MNHSKFIMTLLIINTILLGWLAYRVERGAFILSSSSPQVPPQGAVIDSSPSLLPIPQASPPPPRQTSFSEFYKSLPQETKECIKSATGEERVEELLKNPDLKGNEEEAIKVRSCLR